MRSQHDDDVQRPGSSRGHDFPVLETNLTIQGNRMNVITKKVTSWAAIVAVPTFITGFYGMNVPYPGFAQHWGFVTSAALMIVTAAVLYVIFKAKDWL